MKPRRTTPAAPASTRRARSPAPSTRLSSRWASSRNATPAPVSSTRRLSRSRRLRAHRLLQLLDLPRQRGLGHLEPLRGPAEVQLLGHGDEGTDLVEGDHGPRVRCTQMDQSMPNWAWTGIDRAYLVSVVTLTRAHQGAPSMRKQTLSLAAVAAGAALALSACGGVQNTAGGGSDSGDYPSGAVEMPVGAVRRGLLRPDQPPDLPRASPTSSAAPSRSSTARAPTARSPPPRSPRPSPTARPSRSRTPRSSRSPRWPSREDEVTEHRRLRRRPGRLPRRLRARGQQGLRLRLDRDLRRTPTARSPTAPPVSAPAPSSPAR